MRRTLLPSLLGRVGYNFSRGNRTVRLFELGTGFRLGAHEGPPEEEAHLAVAITGFRTPPHWSGATADTDIWDMKAVAEAVVARAYPGGSTAPATEEHQLLESGEAMSLFDGDGSPVGLAGRIADDRVDAPAWAGPVFGLELVLPDVPPERAPVLSDRLPAFPGVDRDLAFLVPRGVTAGDIESAITTAGTELLSGVRVFDLYEGESLPPGVRSVAYRLRFQAADRTLTDREVDRATDRILKRVKEDLGVEVRG